MSAQELRQAAALIRERAEAATPGPWHPATTGIECGDHWSVIEYPAMATVAHIPSNDGSNDDQRRPDAKHIASWDPTVALAIAKVMDDVALAWKISDGWVRDLDDDAIRFEDTVDGGWLTVARAYLGSES